MDEILEKFKGHASTELTKEKVLKTVLASKPVHDVVNKFENMSTEMFGENHLATAFIRTIRLTVEPEAKTTEKTPEVGKRVGRGLGDI